jgi:hypothetical protein
MVVTSITALITIVMEFIIQSAQHRESRAM